MKGNKGITLIALVVTIIVLLILAGVAIAMLRGDNGILNRASEAKYDNIIGSVDEQVKLAQMNLRTSITSNMVANPGYLATEPVNFKNLVGEVDKDLGVTTTNSSNKEGFAVYQYLDNGTSAKNGTGYILITYTDNALRSSLPATLVADNTFTINGLSFAKATDTTSSNAFSVNKATLAYVIKISNYSCEIMSGAIMTDTVTVEKAATVVSQDTDLVKDASPSTASNFDDTAIGGKDGFDVNPATNAPTTTTPNTDTEP